MLTQATGTLTAATLGFSAVTAYTGGASLAAAAATGAAAAVPLASIWGLMHAARYVGSHAIPWMDDKSFSMGQWLGRHLRDLITVRGQTKAQLQDTLQQQRVSVDTSLAEIAATAARSPLPAAVAPTSARATGTTTTPSPRPPSAAAATAARPKTPAPATRTHGPVAS